MGTCFPTKRGGITGHRVRTCYFCRGEIIEKKIQHVHQWGEKIVLFEDVPAEVCQQCGEVYFSPEVLERMDAVTIEATREEVRL